MDYLNTIYIEWIYLKVELHNLMNISNSLTFREETFQLSLSMKSQLNMNSSGLKRFDSGGGGGGGGVEGVLTS